MSTLGLIFAYLRERWFTTLLHVGMLAIGVAAATALLLFSAQANARLDRDARGIDLVVGAKGSPLQLVLSAVFHADVPTGNISAADLARIANDPLVKQAVPIGLGDTLRGYRIVGAPAEIIAFKGAKIGAGRAYEKPFEAVLGASVAERLGLKIGDTFVGAHGLGESNAEHAEFPYTIVGILAATGGVNDRLVLTSLESVWEVHKPVGPIDARIGGLQAPPAKTEAHDHDHDHGHDGDHDHVHDQDQDHKGEDHAHAHLGAREITAILVATRSPIGAPRLKRQINQSTDLLAARPAEEATRLFALIGTGIDLIRAFAVILIAAALLSVFATLLAALNARRGEVALLRAMGATRGEVFGVLLGQGLVIGLVGVALGLGLGHAMLNGLSAVSMQARDFGVTGAMWHPGEWFILTGGLLAGALAALIPAVAAYRTDIAKTLAEAP
jgi:putative ABC transport system permease protein